MQYKIKLTVTALLMLPAMVLQAASAQDFIASPNEPHGLVVTSVDREAANIYSVYAVAVDGQELARRENALWLKPGEHTIKAINKTTMNRNFVPGLRGDRSREAIEPLTLNVEAGKNYYVGLKANSGRRSDWKLVVWQVEEQ
ncbi:MAG: hypothetical protein PF630_06415 [Gammaproteobacteria bacterium]|jgi:hypothetical protein|nr:hypothetical protein [Gammaproteobacteria bacterium]